MHKSPLINAVVASAYIVLIVTVVNYISPDDQESSLIMPIIMISLFTLSAGIMGYLFLYQPIQLYIDGDKKRAVRFFLNTLSIFAAITALMLAYFVMR